MAQDRATVVGKSERCCIELNHSQIQMTRWPLKMIYGDPLW